MEYRVITQPAAEPVTLEEVMQHLRLVYVAGVAFDEPRIESLITAARQMVEKVTGLAMVPQVIEARASGSFCCGPLILPMASPLRSVTSLGYTVDGGSIQNPVTYRVDSFASPARLFPAFGTHWPWLGGNGEISAVYEVGFDAPETEGGTMPAPKPLIQAILLLVGHWYENREGVIIGTISSELPLGIAYLIAPYRQHVGL